MASFLQGRAQVTRVGASVSAPLSQNGGIPQGTKLGPVLFAVMVNDLVQSWGARIKFADDLTFLEVVPRNNTSLNLLVSFTRLSLHYSGLTTIGLVISTRVELMP